MRWIWCQGIPVITCKCASSMKMTMRVMMMTFFPATDKKSFDFFDVDVEEDVKPKMTVKQTMQKAKDMKLKALQTNLKLKLTYCKENATKKTQVMMKKMVSENPLTKLLGIQKDNWELLEGYEADVLKKTAEELKAKIEEYNNELVDLLEEKDDLEQLRDEKIADIQ